MVDAADIEAIERATLQAVAPEVVESLPGWLLPMDHGTVGRARCAVPLHHDGHDTAFLPAILDPTPQRVSSPAFASPICRYSDHGTKTLNNAVGTATSRR
jgi:N-acetylglutamate synthase